MNDADPFLDAPGPNLERQAKLFVLLYSAGEVESRVRRIYEAILDQSPQIREGNFRLIGTDDLERLFGWYDREFFRGRLGEMILEDESHPIAFRLSRRLVSAAGQTVRQVRRVQRGGKLAVRGRLRDHGLGDPAFQHVSKRRAHGHGRRPGLP